MVIDASVWVNYFLRHNEFHQPSREWLNQQVRDGLPLVEPDLLLAEVGGAVSRGSGRSSIGRWAVSRLLNWPNLEVVAWEGLALPTALLSCDLMLRGAYAFYVLLAKQRGLPLISWDDDQRERGRAVVPVGRPGEPLSWPDR